MSTKAMTKLDSLFEKIKRKQFDCKYIDIRLQINQICVTIENNDLAIKLIELFREYVSKNKWSDARELFNTVRTMGKKLISADKMNFTVGNIVKRIQHVIREECESLKISLKDTSNIT